MENKSNEWVTFTGSDEQIAELKNENAIYGYILRNKDGTESVEPGFGIE